VRPSLADALCAEIEEHAQAQNGICGAEVDRDSLGELLEIAEASRHREAETVVAFVRGRKHGFIEQVRSTVAMREPALDAGLQRPIAHAVREQDGALTFRPRAFDDGLQIGEERHDVCAGLSRHRLVMEIILLRDRQRDQLAERGPAECDDRRVRARHAGFQEPLLIERRARDGVLETVIEAVQEDQQVAARVGEIGDRL